MYRRKHRTPSSVLGVFGEHSSAGYVVCVIGTEENALYVRWWQGWNIGEILKRKTAGVLGLPCHGMLPCSGRECSTSRIWLGTVFKQDIGIGF